MYISSGDAAVLQNSGPYLWGVDRFEIDEGALAAGSFRVASGRFLYQDGTAVEVPDDGLIPARSLDGALREGKPVQVYLGMGRLKESARNVTVVERAEELSAATTRYVSLKRDLKYAADLHSDGPDVPVKHLHHLLRIYFEWEVDELGEHLLIPLARVEEFGGFKLSGQFIPPSLSLRPEPLSKLLCEIRSLLLARCRQLEQYKKQRGVQNSEFGSRDMAYLLALRTLNRHGAYLCHLLEAPSLHPWVVYGRLRELVAELSSFSLRVNAFGEVDGSDRSLPAYEHTKLWECFTAVRELITQLLNDITAGPDYVIRLQKDGAHFSADLKPAMLQGGRRFYLALKTSEDPQSVHESLESVAKLSSRDQISVLTRHALPGLGLRYLATPPQELPRRSGTLYFAVDHHHEQWESVAKGQNLALYWTKAPDDLEVELMVMESK